MISTSAAVDIDDISSVRTELAEDELVAVSGGYYIVYVACCCAVGGGYDYD